MNGNLRRSRALGAAGTLLVRHVELNAATSLTTKRTWPHT